MNLPDLLKLLQGLGNKQGLKVVVVGGIPRDKLLGLEKRINDIDITTGTETQILAKDFSTALSKIMNVKTKTANDGHMSVFLPELKFDFSSNFRTPGIIDLLKNKGIENPTNMEQEIYSRDFFINTLIMSLDLQKIKDISKEGIKDIESKTIRTCLDPENTFKYNTNRIVRVIYLSCKLGFSVDPQIIQWVRKNPHYLSECDNGYLSKNINKSLAFDADRAIYLINKMDIWKYLPMTKELYKYYKGNVK